MIRFLDAAPKIQQSRSFLGVQKACELLQPEIWNSGFLKAVG